MQRAILRAQDRAHTNHDLFDHSDLGYIFCIHEYRCSYGEAHIGGPFWIRAVS